MDESVIAAINKNGDKLNCDSYTVNSLLPTRYKILSNIISAQLTPYVDEMIGDYQRGFRQNRWTIDRIFNTDRF